MLFRIVKTAAQTSAFALLLTGCDFMAAVGSKALALSGFAHSQPATLVMAPGYRVSINGQSVPIFGFDKCPPPDEAVGKIAGAEALAGQSICVVIKPGALSVEVLAGFPDRPEREKWTVEREGDITRLRRPDGGLVVPAS